MGKRMPEPPGERSGRFAPSACLMDDEEICLSCVFSGGIKNLLWMKQWDGFSI